MSTVKLLIAAHKPFAMPKDQELYMPIHVGAKGKEPIGFTPDHTGDNISEKNAYYSELTGLYWAWKNLDCDYLGLVHYRRYFAKKKIGYKEGMDMDAAILSQTDIDQLLKEADVIVPARRKYYIETLYSHYDHTLDGSHLDETRKIIQRLYPEDLAAYDKVMKQRSGYMFNMFIMSKDNADAYCAWLFPIIDELFKVVDTNELSPFEARLFGRVSELLLNVWLAKQDLTVKEVPFIYMDKVNLWKKGTGFLMAKFFGKKYKASF